MVEDSTPPEQPTKKYEPGGAAREAKEANIELIRKLQVRGVVKIKEIQAYFMRQDPPIVLKNRTIERYKGIVKQRNAKRLVKSEELWKTVEELALELRDNYREVTKEAWRIVNNRGTSPNDKLKAMALITTISQNWIERLQSLGLVHEEPEKHQIIGADGKPIDPPVNPTQINIDNLNMEFTSYIKAKFQDPVGSTGDFKNLSRKQVIDVSQQSTQGT